jgi:hypothetical protein
MTQCFYVFLFLEILTIFFFSCLTPQYYPQKFSKNNKKSKKFTKNNKKSKKFTKTTKKRQKNLKNLEKSSKTCQKL